MYFALVLMSILAWSAGVLLYQYWAGHLTGDGFDFDEPRQSEPGRS